MTLVTRSANIQLRVVPLIKQASERVLYRIGLNMSEAVELFLRRVIIDERLPFDVIALDDATLTTKTATKRSESPAKNSKKEGRGASRQKHE